MPTVSAAGKTYAVAIPDPNSAAHCTPASVAPNVFAIVFAVRIADVVSSMLRTQRSSIAPRRGDCFLRRSISISVVLSTTASSVEHSAETPSVRIIVIARYAIYGSCLSQNVGSFANINLSAAEFRAGAFRKRSRRMRAKPRSRSVPIRGIRRGGAGRTFRAVWAGRRAKLL